MSVLQEMITEGSCLMQLLGPGKSRITKIALGKFLANDLSNEINSTKNRISPKIALVKYI